MKNTTASLSLFLFVLLFFSCSTNKKTTFWVNSTKTECDAGVGKMLCLNVHRCENLDNPKWENFYAHIEGFEFEEGYLKKISIKEEKVDNVPADASSVKYTMIEELEKKIDKKVQIDGKWILNTINNSPINRSIRLPNIELNLTKMSLRGSGGCNNYSGQIKSLTDKKISFGNIASTEKACAYKHIEAEYFSALRKTTAYHLNDDIITFNDKGGNKVLSYMKKEEPEVNQRLHDIWNATRIMGSPINRMSPIPRLEINLTEMKVFGNDGCNNFNGKIKTANENHLLLGNIASTKKLCSKMEAANNFNNALSNIASYTLDGLNLKLFNKEGEEVLAFLKGD